MNDNDIKALLDRTADLAGEPGMPSAAEDLGRARRALRRRRSTAIAGATCGVLLTAGAAYGGVALLEPPDPPPGKESAFAGVGEKGDRSGAPRGAYPRDVLKPVYMKPEFGTIEPGGTACQTSPTPAHELAPVAEWKHGASGGWLLVDKQGKAFWCFSEAAGDGSSTAKVNAIKGAPPAPVTDPTELRRYTGYVTCLLEDCSKSEISGMGVLPRNIARMAFDMPDGKVVEAAVRDGRWMLHYTMPKEYGEPKRLRVRMADTDGRLVFDEQVSRGVAEGQTTETDMSVPKASFSDTVEKHIPSKAYDEVGLTTSGDSETAWGTWTGGKQQGTVVVAVLRPGDEMEEWIVDGPDGSPCAILPVKSGNDGAFTWKSCAAEDLPNGDRLLIASGADAAAPARAATLIERDGTIVTIAQSTAYFERSPSQQPVAEPELDSLPLSDQVMRAVVTDPDML